MFHEGKKMVSGLFRGGRAAQLDAVAFELDRHDVLQHQAGSRLPHSSDRAMSRSAARNASRSGAGVSTETGARALMP